MNRETLIDSIGKISDRFIDEYAAATTAREIKKRRTQRILRYVLIPAACICLALSMIPLSRTIFNQDAHASDWDWVNYHAENIAASEYTDLLISRLPGGSVGSQTSLFHDKDGRYDREKWNVLGYSTAYSSPGVFDFVSLYVYFPNNFVPTDDPENRYKTDGGGVYDHFSQGGTTMEINGVTVKYADLSANNGYSNGYISGRYTDAEFDALDSEIIENYRKNGIASKLSAEALNVSVARQKASWCKFYTAGFEYDGVFYVLDVCTRYRADPLEYYLSFLLGSGDVGSIS